ncbi:peptidase M24 [Anaerosporomusa subterranea]|uniref:Peptidase M24 n=1 Tax=Anaerosporomusa subterranea TaxID=1794912 RepID=A0A154BU31_ANASB|nr:aminopeptidase P family protein [Anaerosporomusa subterranea]KYZ77534.1 peptidase M24 [Anaerosporomusa subterranea]
MQRRLELLRAFMAEQKLDSLLVSKSQNCRYFSGFTGSAGVLFITAHTAQLITDFRYIEQAAKQAQEFEIIRHGNSMYETIGRLARELNVKKLGFETEYVSYETYGLLGKALAASELCPVKLDLLRAQKDQEEMALIKQAVVIADAAFAYVVDIVHIGMSELEVAFELETRMRKLGSEKPAFDTIVASGKRSAMPHGVATDKLLESGDFVTLDFGAVYQGYHSDMTRTLVMGQPTEKQRQVYQTVLTAQLEAVQAVKAGRLCRDVDAVARDLITTAGYGEYFGHGLGHCVGLMIHEEPRLSPTNETGRLAENMAVTVEPGIYIPDWGGVRIEDIVVVTASGCDILTTSSKQLIEIDR